jgi:hypothetical protein
MEWQDHPWFLGSAGLRKVCFCNCDFKKQTSDEEQVEELMTLTLITMNVNV